jgi:hypothetical protein
MAALSVTNPTLLDIAKASDPDGKIAQVVEILNETNEVLDDMSWQEGNLSTGHRTTIRSGLPTPTWRKLYGGVQPTKGRTTQVTDNCGMLEAYAEIDKALADLNGNTSAYRLLEDSAHIEGISQELAETLFFGDEGTEPEAFTGFAPRFNLTTADNGENIIVGGGSGADNASIWLVVWGPRTVHGIIPKGSKAGIQMEDKGQVTIEDADGSNGRMEAYRTHYRFDAGLTVRDWRYIVRIPNIDKSNLTSDASSSSADLPDLMHQAITQIPNLSVGRAVWYMSRNTMSFVRRQVSAAVSGSTLTTENVGGTFQTSFMGIPMKRSDALAADEALVS